MNLSEATYLLFLAVAALLYWIAARGGKRPLLLLVLFSFVFYSTWNVLYCVPLLVTTLTDFFVAMAIERTKEVRKRRLLLAISLIVDLGLLAFFKYLPIHVVFLAGISFYTFQSLSYVFDVYQDNQKATRSFLEYLAFVSFFPTLLAGPITRAETLFPQLRKAADFDSSLACQGLFLIALGFVKKCVIADALADSMVNRVFDQPLFFSSAEVLAGVYAYAAQIYCDFSGYSDIAIGSAMLLGIKLKDNFNSPYRSADLGEFWRRWHISLSTWLRDYLYFSLPGNRTRVMPYVNLIVTFALAGLWHGASYTFVLWGLLHGVGLAFHRAWAALTGGKMPRWLAIFVTFHFVAFAWIFFRCDNLAQAGDLLGRLSEHTTGTGNIPLSGVIATLAAIGLQFAPENLLPRLRKQFAALPSVAQGLLLAAAALLVRWVGGVQVSPFIYQRF